MDISEIAAPTTGNEDFLPRALGNFQHGNAPSPSARFNRAH
jgi:hypothetical protein